MNKKTLMAWLSITGVAFCSTGQAGTGEVDEAVALETLTVTGTRSEKTIFESPQSVSVLTQEDIQRSGQESLAEMMRDIPGVQILDASVPGMKRIEIRGESSRRTVILIDGQEITDHSSYGTPLLIDPSAVQRIEVVKGPSSVLYGSKAIGGVVNIITKRGGAEPIEGELSASWFSTTEGYQAGGSLLGAFGNWDYRLTGSIADHADRKTAHETLDGSSFSNDSFSGHLGYRSGKHYFAFKAEQYDMESDSYVDPDLIGFPITEFALDLPQRDRQKFGVFYYADDLAPWLPKIHFDAYHQTIDRLFTQDLALSFGGPAGLTSSSESDDTGTTDGATLQINTQPHPNHELIFGTQYLDDRLDVVKTSTTTILPFPGVPMTSVATDDATIETWSIYVQDEWSLPNDFNLLFGLRYYDVSARLKASNHAALTSNSDSELVGSVGLTYAGIENHVLRIYAGQGYVYPTLLQLFVDSPFGGGGLTFGNPDLSPETSDSIEFGWRYQADGLVVNSSVFYSQADDYIAHVFFSDGRNGTWENINEAKTHGAELFAEYDFGVLGNLTTYVNGTWTRRKFTTPEYSTYDTLTPELTGRLGLKFNLGQKSWGDVFVRGATSAKLEDETGIIEESDSWTTLNLWLGMDIGQTGFLQLVAHFNNITDEYYHPANELPGIGRSVDLTARIQF